VDDPSPLSKLRWNVKCHELIASNGEFFVLTSDVGENSNKQFNPKVGLIKFVAK